MTKKEATYRINGRFEFIKSKHLLKDLDSQENIKLEPLMAETLSFLIENRGEVIHRNELIKRFWNSDSFADEALTKVISKLRKELKDDSSEPKYIETLSKIGYEWIGEVEIKESYLQVIGNKIPVIHFNNTTITGLTLILVILFVIKSIFITHH